MTNQEKQHRPKSLSEQHFWEMGDQPKKSCLTRKMPRLEPPHTKIVEEGPVMLKTAHRDKVLQTPADSARV